MADLISMQIKGLDDAVSGIGSTAQAVPGAAARSLNAAIQSARELIIEAAMERYAFSESGERRMNDLKITERASSGRLSAKMQIKKLKSDLGYYEHAPEGALPGALWRLAPSGGYSGHVLRGTSMTTLGGAGNLSKAFIAHFKSGHDGMVQRVIGSKSSHTVTASGAARWKNRIGDVEKLQTVGSASTAAQANVVWPDQERESVEAFFHTLTEIMGGA